MNIEVKLLMRELTVNGYRTGPTNDKSFWCEFE